MEGDANETTTTQQKTAYEAVAKTVIEKLTESLAIPAGEHGPQYRLVHYDPQDEHEVGRIGIEPLVELGGVNFHYSGAVADGAGHASIVRAEDGNLKVGMHWHGALDKDAAAFAHTLEGVLEQWASEVARKGAVESGPAHETDAVEEFPREFYERHAFDGDEEGAEKSAPVEHVADRTEEETEAEQAASEARSSGLLDTLMSFFRRK